MVSILLYCAAVGLAFAWLALRIHSHRVRGLNDQQTTWAQRSRGLPTSVYAVVIGLAAISLLGVVWSVHAAQGALFGVAISIAAAIAAAGLRRHSFAAQYGDSQDSRPSRGGRVAQRPEAVQRAGHEARVSAPATSRGTQIGPN